MPRRRRRPPLAVLALAAVTVAVVVIAILAVGSPSASTAREREVKVARGVVQSTVSGSGSLSPANQLALNFKTSGVVTHVYVKAGEHVSEGELLATLDSSSAEVSLAQAKADLQTAQDNLTKARSASTTSSSSSATAATAATASIASADADAPSSRDSDGTAPKTSNGGNNGSSNNSSNPANSSTPNNSGNSGSTMSVAAAQAAVDSAELAVSDAEQAVASTKLRAPMPGTIAEVSGATGDSVSAGSGNGSNAAASGTDSGFVTLAQLSRYTMEVSLSESDIGKVKKGQAATVTVNAASGEEFEAHVTDIAVLSSAASDSSGTGGGGGSSAVSYAVTLTLDQTSKKLKAGMSASADIVVAQATGLVVPTQALQGNSVTVLRDGERSTQQVQTGVAGDSTTQILSGLKEGDTVIVTSTAAAAAASGNGNAAGPGGGLGRFGGGGFGGGGGPVFRAGPGP